MSVIWHPAREQSTIIKSVISSIPRIPDVVIKPVAEDISKEAKRNAPVDTGALKRGITVAKINDGYQIYGKEYYTVYQEEGTRYFRGRFFMKNAITRGLPKLLNTPIQKIFAIT
jgi:hypothetical protein